MKRIICGIVVITLLLTFSFFATIPPIKSNSYIHVSFDDVIDVFKDLTANAETYSSVFDNPFLGTLQSLHKRYGATFSLYCYFESGSFNLSQCTDKFASELAENSSWLKFGFHSTDGSSDLEHSTADIALAEYTSVISELERITGGSQSIDTVVRLHCYAGNTEAIEALKDAHHGIGGLLTADDTRQSYDLSPDDNTFIYQNDVFYDSERDLLFVSTDLRLENTDNPYSSLNSIEKNENQNKAIEVFTHEWLVGKRMRIKLEIVCMWAYRNGYNWGFASDLLNLPSDQI